MKKVKKGFKNRSRKQNADFSRNQMRGMGRWLTAVLAGTGCVAFAQDDSLSTGDVGVGGGGSVSVLNPTRIIGSSDALREIPGSAVVIERELIERYSLTDINRALRLAPGVYVREEDGYGNFPNISIRGVTTVRNSKLTVMEDGILSAPAPYTEPAAYYSPALGRMSGLEVIKGSSQIKYGPHITGGVLNYLSAPIPTSREIYLKSYYGSFNEVFALARYGDLIPTEAGTIGFLAEGFFHRSDGFKTIDAAPGVDRDATGFQRIEPMLKLSFQPNSSRAQLFEAKYGFTDFVADETYLGLTETDFQADPFRRYSASRLDRIPTEHHRSYLRHWIEVNEHLQVATTGYYNHFSRAWFKANDVRLAGDTSWRNLSETLAGAHGVNNALDVLRGTEAGLIRYRNNNRTYTSYGIQQQYLVSFETGQLDHTLEAGVRYHIDDALRFQNDTVFNQDTSGAWTVGSVGVPGSQDHRMQKTEAWAFHVQDNIRYGRLGITPGIRFETMGFMLDNRNNAAPIQRDRLDVMAGGLGFTYDVNQDWTLLTGAHRGFAVPGPQGAINNGLKEESSMAVEAGARYNNRRGLSFEAIYFYTRFQDLIVDSNAGGGGLAANTENAGDVNVHGVEFMVQYDAGLARDWVVRTPVSLAFTYTDARFANDASSVGSGGGSVESIFSGAEKGNRLPYLPEYQLTATAGLEYKFAGIYLTGTYVPSTFTTGSNSPGPFRPDGTPDARFGTTDPYFLLDLSTRYQVRPQAALFMGIRNLTDREYIASRIPHGPRPGMDRMFYGGLELTF